MYTRYSKCVPVIVAAVFILDAPCAFDMLTGGFESATETINKDS